MRIVLTNDDGIYAVGLRVLYDALLERGHEVHVMAPMTEQSAVGHAITILSPLRAKLISEPHFEGYGIFGTPADCVKLAIGELLNEKPDMVVSGMNAGANVGPDILYSGTVAAATEACHLGYRSVAVSFDSYSELPTLEHGHYAAEFVEKVAKMNIPARRVMNLNMPACPVSDFKGLKFCEQTQVVWRDWYHQREDPRNRSYWWLNGEIPPEKLVANTDRYCLTDGFATVTPLKFEFTDFEMLSSLNEHF